MDTEFVLSLGEQRWTLPAGADTVTIGRASNADIRLQADDQISRIHARLTRDPATGSWVLHDESRNGTGLNGRRLTAPTPLAPGDQLHIGRSVLSYHPTQTSSPAHNTNPPAAPVPTPAAPPPAPVPSPTPPPAGPAPTSTPPYPADGPVSSADGAGLASDSQQAGPDPELGEWDGRNPFAPAAQPAPPSALPDSSPLNQQYAEQEAPQYNGQPSAQYNGQAAPQYDEASAQYDEASAQYDGAPAQYDGQAAGQYDGYAGGPYEPQVDGVAPGDEGASVYEGLYAPAEEADEYGAAGVVPGFEADPPRSGDSSDWAAAYPSAENPEPVRSPWEISAQIDQSQPNWNESDGWPDGSVATDRRAPGDRRSPGVDRRSGADRRTANRLPGSDQRGPSRRSTDVPDTGRRTDPGDGSGDDTVGTVRLPRILIAAGGLLLLGIVVNLIVIFLADDHGGMLRWLIAPAIALIVAMVLAVLDAASPTHHIRGRLDVPVLAALAVVLIGVGVGGFAVTAGAEYVAGYLSGNESGADRLVKPAAESKGGISVTVENVTYTSHFTRVEVLVANGGKEAFTIPLDGTTFTAADGTALHADTGKSSWPSRVAAGGSEHGTITFTGHLPDGATAAALTFKSGDTSFTVQGVALSN